MDKPRPPPERLQIDACPVVPAGAAFGGGPKPMDFVSHPGLLIAGAVTILIGLLIRRFVSRYDFAGLAMNSAWQVARGRRTAESPTEIEERLNEITAATTTFGKARRLGGNVIGHFVAPILGLIGLILILGGAALLGAAYFLH